MLSVAFAVLLAVATLLVAVALVVGHWMLLSPMNYMFALAKARLGVAAPLKVSAVAICTQVVASGSRAAPWWRWWACLWPSSAVVVLLAMVLVQLGQRVGLQPGLVVVPPLVLVVVVMWPSVVVVVLLDMVLQLGMVTCTLPRTLPLTLLLLLVVLPSLRKLLLVVVALVVLCLVLVLC